MKKAWVLAEDPNSGSSQLSVPPAPRNPRPVVAYMGIETHNCTHAHTIAFTHAHTNKN